MIRERFWRRLEEFAYERHTVISGKRYGKILKQQEAREKAWCEKAWADYQALPAEKREAIELKQKIREAASWGVWDENADFLMEHGYQFIPDNHPSGKAGVWVLDPDGLIGAAHDR